MGEVEAKDSIPYLSTSTKNVRISDFRIIYLRQLLIMYVTEFEQLVNISSSSRVG